MFKQVFAVLSFLLLCLKVMASDYGVTGIIDMPTSRMMNDGDLKVSINKQKIANIYNLTYQATPWLETTFRYTDFSPENLRDGLKDRSYEAKIKLLKEGFINPEIAIGIRDLIGTGAWNSEYIVASKRINNLDFSLGLGWGRLARRSKISNPFGKISDDFLIRDYDVGVGGKPRTSSFFSGKNSGIFGGITYDIESLNIQLLMEYNSDDYNREYLLGTISDSEPLSYGIKWYGNSNANISISYQHGNQIGLLFSSKINTKKLPDRKEISSFYSSLEDPSLSKLPKNLDLGSWYDKLMFDMEKSGLLLRKAKISDNQNEVMIEISNLSFNITADAINQAIRLSEVHLPQSISVIKLVINEYGFRANSIRYYRKNRKSFFYGKRNENSFEILEPIEIDDPSNFTVYSVPHVTFGADLASKFQIFDPDKPIKSQLFLKLSATAALPNDWFIRGSYSYDIDNNFDLARGPNSVLPNVRSNINKYLYEGASGIEALYLYKRSSISETLFYRVYLGLLEDMFGGGGLELLYQPFKSRVAFGITINSLKQRDTKRNLSFLDYKTTTGYFSAYYASPFYNFDVALHVGKYLAKDKGATLELRRTFDNGFSVGAFASKTNVSSEDFGEGSFDKGLFFKIPFDSFTKMNTKRSFSTIVRSVQRDGGQRLNDFSGTLWFDMRNVRYDALQNNRARMILQ